MPNILHMPFYSFGSLEKGRAKYTMPRFNNFSHFCLQALDIDAGLFERREIMFLKMFCRVYLFAKDANLMFIFRIAAQNRELT
jgi:hypothetical protein